MMRPTADSMTALSEAETPVILRRVLHPPPTLDAQPTFELDRPLRKLTDKTRQTVTACNKDSSAIYTLSWLLYVVAAIFSRYVFSSGGFSSILTLSAGFQMFGVLLLVYHLDGCGNAVGISGTFLMVESIALLFRLSSTVFYNGYLPVDRSGDWLYQSADALSVAGSAFAAYYISKAAKSLQGATSGFPNRGISALTWTVMIVVAAACAVLFQPDLNRSRVPDVFWMFSVHLETLAIVSQLIDMRNIRQWRNSVVTHFLVSLLASKSLQLLFWQRSLGELAPRWGPNLPGFAVVGALGAQLLILLAIMLYHLKECLRYRAMQLPTISGMPAVPITSRRS